MFKEICININSDGIWGVTPDPTYSTPTRRIIQQYQYINDDQIDDTYMQIQAP